MDKADGGALKWVKGRGQAGMCTWRAAERHIRSAAVKECEKKKKVCYKCQTLTHRANNNRVFLEDMSVENHIFQKPVCLLVYKRSIMAECCMSSYLLVPVIASSFLHDSPSGSITLHQKQSTKEFERKDELWCHLNMTASIFNLAICPKCLSWFRHGMFTSSFPLALPNWSNSNMQR